jgi:ubiquinol-cytochrome c reductase cytochrome c subunit
MRELVVAACVLVLSLAVMVGIAPWSSAPSAEAADAAEAGSAERGAELYVTACASCHGSGGGGTSIAPSIVDAGAASVDFQLRTGRMPASAAGAQPPAKPPAFDEQQIRDLVAYVASFGDGPAIPEVRLDDELLPRGQELFVANCAPCHGATISGGAVGGGAVAPSLRDSTPLIVAEAMVTGPGQMPTFDLAQRESDAIATYVEFMIHAPNPGGFSIGHIGPVPEGFVGWFVGMLGMVVIVVAVAHAWGRGADRE